jgi:hypothetical protein
MIALVPSLLDGEMRRDRPASRLVIGVAALCCLGTLVIGANSVTRLPAKVSAAFPNTVATTVATETNAHPGMTVFASERYADWLLWKDPALAGRLVYDIRFELFNRKLFDQLLAFHEQTGSDWLRMLHGARLVVLYRKTDHRAAAALRREPGTRVLYENHDLVVILRRPSV